MISFTNDTTFNLIDSDVQEVHFFSSDNVVLDSKHINPSVFKDLRFILTHESIKYIDNKILGRFRQLRKIQIDAYYFRKITHQQGIEWIKSKNRGLNVNLSDFEDVKRNSLLYFQIMIKFIRGTSISDVFPDVDLCLYRDFPFHQLVFLNPFLDLKTYNLQNLQFLPKLTCTFRWLKRFYFPTIWPPNLNERIYMNASLASGSKTAETCDFGRLVAKCNKYRFQSRHIWDVGEAKIFTKYILLVITISSYVMSLFGILTNSIFIHMILSKLNQDIFKGFKHYPFLCAMSIFNLSILVIQIFSWLWECKNIYDVFCPPTSRLVALQFLKIIFRDTSCSAQILEQFRLHGIRLKPSRVDRKESREDCEILIRSECEKVFYYHWIY